MNEFVCNPAVDAWRGAGRARELTAVNETPNSTIARTGRQQKGSVGFNVAAPFERDCSVADPDIRLFALGEADLAPLFAIRLRCLACRSLSVASFATADDPASLNRHRGQRGLHQHQDSKHGKRRFGH